MRKRITRREMLVALAATVGGGCIARAASHDLEPEAYLPLVSKMPTSTPTATSTGTATAAPTVTPTYTVTPPATATGTPVPLPIGSQVVHVHSSEATSWNGQTDYWNYVVQSVVDKMVNRGLTLLTGTSRVADAWAALLPNYKVGQGIAIKINLNNSTACDDADGQIDALMQPVNAVVRGLKQRGVAEADIWVYDASRHIPARLVSANQHVGIQLLDKACRGFAGFSSKDPSAYVAFSPPAGIPTPPAIKVTDVVIDASYLINMPIVKPHSIAGVTLGFKNHMGTIDQPFRLHDYIGLDWDYYRPDYSALVDLYRNSNIGPKTVLTLGDGLIAALAFNGTPSAWATFGGKVPNSLLFATDPVAVDCVMTDLLAAELDSGDDAVPDASYDYLRLAAANGLGTFEQGDPWGGGYSHIDYQRVEL